MKIKSGLQTLEHKSHRLLSPLAFFLRLARNFAAASILIGLSLFAGMCGYRYIGEMSWVAAFENASMILSGMGPVESMKSDAGKIFAGCYALYSGLALIVASAILLTPVLHRIMHKLHLEDEK